MKTSMFLRWLEARVAQLAERRIRNAKVGSSILPAGLKPSFSVGAAFFISWGRSFISPNPSYSGRMSLVMAGSLVL